MSRMISDRDSLLPRPQPVLGSNEPFTRLLDSENPQKLFQVRTVIFCLLKRELNLCDKSAADSYSTFLNGRIEESWRITIRRIHFTKIERKS